MCKNEERATYNKNCVGFVEAFTIYRRRQKTEAVNWHKNATAENKKINQRRPSRRRSLHNTDTMVKEATKDRRKKCNSTVNVPHGIEGTAVRSLRL